MLRIVDAALPYTNPDWDGTVTERTVIYLVATLGVRSEYLFRRRSVATNLVTSLKLQPILCAIVLCHFGQTQNG